MGPRAQNYAVLGATLRTLANTEGVKFRFSPHAEAEMAKDRIDRPDIERLCRTGSVIRCEQHSRKYLGGPFEPHDRLTVMGRDLEERSISAVVYIDGDEIEVQVITAWAGQRRRTRQ